MSCDDCDKAHDETPAFYYRIENANVQVKGCRKHVAMMFGMIDGRKRGTEKPVVSDTNTNPVPETT